MFRNIIVGVDRHGGGRDAIALATKLLARGGRLTLAHVYLGEPHPWHGPPAGHDLKKLERIEELLESARNQARVAADLRWRNATSVGRGLHELCELMEADLLVVGSSRHGRLGRVLMRDDTHAALAGARCAIAIAPGGYAQRAGDIVTIGVGYDGSPESRNALEVARRIAAENRAQLSGLQVVSSPEFSYTGDESVDAAIARRLEEAWKRMAALGEIEPHTAYGLLPAEELSLYSASVDLLVIGARGYGPIGTLMHGSVSQQLARSAQCPLLVLPRSVGTAYGEDEAEREPARVGSDGDGSAGLSVDSSP